MDGGDGGDATFRKVLSRVCHASCLALPCLALPCLALPCISLVVVVVIVVAVVVDVLTSGYPDPRRPLGARCGRGRACRWFCRRELVGGASSVGRAERNILCWPSKKSPLDPTTPSRHHQQRRRHQQGQIALAADSSSSSSSSGGGGISSSSSSSGSSFGMSWCGGEGRRGVRDCYTLQKRPEIKPTDPPPPPSPITR